MVSTTPLPTLSGSHYFNTIFKTHLYYKRSAKDPNDKEDTFQYVYPTSSGSSTSSIPRRPNSSRLRLVRVGTVSNHAIPNEPTQLSPPPSSRGNSLNINVIKSGSRIAPKSNENVSPQRSSAPSILVKRGKFKGFYDDRSSRCSFLGVPNHNHYMCYCSNLPIIESPLKRIFNNPSHVESTHDEPNVDESGPDGDAVELHFDSNSIKLKETHIIARVCHKLVTGVNDGSPYDFGLSPRRRSVRKIHSLNNMRKFGIHYRIQEEDEDGEIEAPTLAERANDKQPIAV